MDCSAHTGNPCKCRRMSGECVKCGREVTVSHGERATPIETDNKGRMVNYTCFKCRGYDA